MPTWDDILTDRDKEVFALSGYGAKAGFGQRPAVLIIDVNYNFVGDRREPIIESVKRFRNSCGEEGWVGVDHIVTLLEEARKKHLPDILHHRPRRGGVRRLRPLARQELPRHRGFHRVGQEGQRDRRGNRSPEGRGGGAQAEAQRFLRHPAHQHA